MKRGKLAIKIKDTERLLKKIQKTFINDTNPCLQLDCVSYHFFNFLFFQSISGENEAKVTTTEMSVGNLLFCPQQLLLRLPPFLRGHA